MKIKKLIYIVFLTSMVYFFSCSGHRENDFPKEESLSNSPVLVDEVDDIVSEEPSERPKETILEKVELSEERGIGLRSDPIQDEDNTELPSIQESQSAKEKEDLEYEANLTADGEFKSGKYTGVTVWIGTEKYKREKKSGQVRDSVIIHNIAEAKFAKVTLSAPDFEVQDSTYKYLKIDPTGASEVFWLKPKQDQGDFSVTATVTLYDDESCTGIGTTKSVDPLLVSVKVDHKNIFQAAVDKVCQFFVDKTAEFCIAVITFVFVSLLFVVKRKVKKKTGYEE